MAVKRKASLSRQAWVSHAYRQIQALCLQGRPKQQPEARKKGFLGSPEQLGLETGTAKENRGRLWHVLKSHSTCRS